MFTSNKPKLTEEQVQKIRELYYLELYSLSKLAVIYTVGRTTIADIVHARKRFADITFPLGITDDVIEKRKPHNQTYVGVRKLAKMNSREKWVLPDQMEKREKQREYTKRHREKKEMESHASQIFNR